MDFLERHSCYVASQRGQEYLQTLNRLCCVFLIKLATRWRLDLTLDQPHAGWLEHVGKGWAKDEVRSEHVETHVNELDHILVGVQHVSFFIASIALHWGRLDSFFEDWTKGEL